MSNKSTDERFTPKPYIESVRKVLGKIDLDPASSRLANIRINADCIFTIEDSGLAAKWFGNVFCNPPYSRGNLEKWSTKIRFEHEQRNTKNSIYLIPNDPSTNWFKIVNNFPFCLTDHRIPFLCWDGKRFIYEKNPKNSSIIMLLSDDLEIYRKFFVEFAKHGPIYRRIHGV